MFYHLKFLIKGMVGSGTSVLAISSLANIFIGSPWMMSLEIYLGLLCFVGYICIDTQMIIYKATKLGDRDTIGHAVQLFTDAVAVFVR